MGEKSRPNFKAPIEWCKKCGEVKCKCKKKKKKALDKKVQKD